MSLSELEARLGVHIEPALLELALSHPSHSEGDATKPNYQRLEFLGDALLGFVVSDLLYRRFSEFSEKELTKLKTAIVKESALSDLAKDLDLGPFIRMSHGMRTFDRGAERPSILSDVYEAILGAIHLSNGIDVAYEFVHKQILHHLENYRILLTNDDPRARLHDWAKAQGYDRPEYSVLAYGRAHKIMHEATLVVAGKTFRARAPQGSSAKVAAAKKALENLANGSLDA